MWQTGFLMPVSQGGNSGGGGQLSPFIPISSKNRHRRPTCAQPASPQASMALSCSSPAIRLVSTSSGGTGLGWTLKSSTGGRDAPSVPQLATPALKLTLIRHAVR